MVPGPGLTRKFPDPTVSFSGPVGRSSQAPAPTVVAVGRPCDLIGARWSDWALLVTGLSTVVFDGELTP